MVLDFQEIKARVKIEDVVPMLGLVLKQTGDSYRGKCPACNSGNDRALALTKGKGYYCFAQQKGGDVIALVSHIRGIGARQAAQEIVDHFHLTGQPAPQEPASKPVPQAAKEKATPAGTRTLEPLTYLLCEHEAVQALGIDPATAARLGIGFAPKGLMRGRVVIPLYAFPLAPERVGDPHERTLVGYLGIAPGADVKVPTNLAERLKQ